MSADSVPITPSAFAAALKDLPLSSLYAKALELQNSISHLERSNAELKLFLQDLAQRGDTECEDAIVENEEVVRRMLHRIELVKAEVEERGQKWMDDLEPPLQRQQRGQGDVDMADEGGVAATTGTSAGGGNMVNGHAHSTTSAPQGNPDTSSRAQGEDEQNENTQNDGVYL